MVGIVNNARRWKSDYRGRILIMIHIGMICLLLSPIVTSRQYDTEPASLMNCNVNFGVLCMNVNENVNWNIQPGGRIQIVKLIYRGNQNNSGRGGTHYYHWQNINLILLVFICIYLTVVKQIYSYVRIPK